MQLHIIHRAMLAGAIGAALGCSGGQERADLSDAQAAMPDTTAASVWAHMQDAGYRSWALWPEKGRLYTGGEPHGMLLTTYINDLAAQALAGTATRMPAGAVIVKENYMPDSTLAAITIMYKSPGYNPEHNDWFFIKRLADGTVEASGRLAGCQGCHGARRDNDYILTADLN
jgi:hypothetical protein